MLVESVIKLIVNETIEVLINKKRMPDIAVSELNEIIGEVVYRHTTVGANLAHQMPPVNEKLLKTEVNREGWAPSTIAQNALVEQQAKLQIERELVEPDAKSEKPIPSAVTVSAESLEAWEKLRHFPPNKQNLLKAITEVMRLHGRETSDAVLSKFDANSLTERPSKKVLPEDKYEAAYLMMMDTLAGTYSPLN